MPEDKTMTAAEAVADIPEGARIMFGAFGGVQDWAVTTIAALRARGVGGLTAIANSGGYDEWALQGLALDGRLAKFIATFGISPYGPTPVSEGVAAGRIAYEVVPQGTFVERIRAAAGGIPAFYTPVGAGTKVAEGKEVRRFGDREYVLEEALAADYAFIRGWKADRSGNVQYRGSTRNFNRMMAGAARITIAEVSEIVETGELDPEQVGTPGIFVDRVVLSEPPDSVLLARFQDAGWRPPRELPPEDTGKPRLSDDLMAMRVAALFPAGAWVNLGFGLPMLVSRYVFDRGIHLHAENGIANYGPLAAPDEIDIRVYNAGTQAVTLLPGAAYFDSADAFMMARGGHLDGVVLGSYEVSEHGDFANWYTPRMAGGGIGGAMDLVANTRDVVIMMRHTTRAGAPRLLRQCTLPLTGVGCVTWVMTDLGLFRPTPEGLVIEEVAPGWTLDEVQALTEPALIRGAEFGDLRL